MVGSGLRVQPPTSRRYPTPRPRASGDAPAPSETTLAAPSLHADGSTPPPYESHTPDQSRFLQHSTLRTTYRIAECSIRVPAGPEAGRHRQPPRLVQLH